MTHEAVHETVRAHYARAALAVADRGCCAERNAPPSERPSCCSTGRSNAPESDGATLYPALDQAAVPEAAVVASMGCGNPVAVAELRAGERVLDLGSGGGIDVLLSAGRVGPTGRVFGLDMTDEMLDLARRNAAAAGVSNVEFLKGTIEAIPLPAGSVDVVISNCVINLAADASAVFREIARVLKPGGRIGVADIVAEDHLTPDERAARGTHVGCIAGARSFTEYRAGLEAAGLEDVSLTPTHAVADGMVSAIVRAVKPRA